jgi:biopolymer transport protein ExbD
MQGAELGVRWPRRIPRREPEPDMVREHAAVPMVDLNTTPLIDVMLVLLIIFMIAAPMMAHRLPLPNEQPGPKPAEISARHEIGVEAIGSQVRLTLDGELVSESMLVVRLQAAGRLPVLEQGEYRINAMGDVRFETVAGLMAIGKRAGLARVGLE